MEIPLIILLKFPYNSIRIPIGFLHVGIPQDSHGIPIGLPRRNFHRIPIPTATLGISLDYYLKFHFDIKSSIQFCNQFVYVKKSYSKCLFSSIDDLSIIVTTRTILVIIELIRILSACLTVSKSSFELSSQRKVPLMMNMYQQRLL